jgi:L-iditol 2-dehydrogenase
MAWLWRGAPRRAIPDQISISESSVSVAATHVGSRPDLALGADEIVNVNSEDPVAAVARITRGKGVQYVLECSGAPNALNEAARMVNRGGRICLAAFPADPVPVDLAYLVRNNIYVFGIRGEGKSATHRAAALMAQKRFDAKMIHTHTFPLAEVPTAIKYARERIEDAIKVVVKIRGN